MERPEGEKIRGTALERTSSARCHTAGHRATAFHVDKASIASLGQGAAIMSGVLAF
jgi:hypothetical protein